MNLNDPRAFCPVHTDTGTRCHAGCESVRIEFSKASRALRKYWIDHERGARPCRNPRHGARCSHQCEPVRRRRKKT